MSHAHTERLLQHYHGPNTNDIFIHPNTQNILSEIAKDAELSKIPRKEILAFKRTLYDLSRSMEQRILRGEKRYLSHRKWLVYNIGNYPVLHLYILSFLSFIATTHTFFQPFFHTPQVTH